MAARKALKQSLKELDGAETDRACLQKQVNKLSRTLEVSPHHVFNICQSGFYGSLFADGKQPVCAWQAFLLL